MHTPDAAASAPPVLRVRHDETVPVLVIPDDLPFAHLREWIRVELPAVIGELGGRASRLDLGARPIQLFDVRRLLHLLRDEFQVEVTGLYVRPDAVHRYAERELKLKLFLVDDDAAGPDGSDAPPDPTDAPLPGLADLTAALAGDDAAPDGPEDAPPAEDADVDEDTEPDAPDLFEAVRRPIPTPDLPDEEPEVDEEGGRRTLHVRRTLRSGTAIRYDGDVVVLGDVNPGAQVRAGGNVIVLGKLKGTVHAGAHGDEDAFILALQLAPTQLRIARLIAIAPKKRRGRDPSPELASVRDGRIEIEPYGGRSRR